jgi:phosphohistidine phosphatase
MKTLYIIRHAKSSWGDITLPDFERPLNDRGKKDAPLMAGFLKSRGGEVDVILSSPAKRALQTAQIFCQVLGYDPLKMERIDRLYHAPSTVFFDEIKKLNPQHRSAAIFSHNPGITDFVNEVGAGVRIDNMPTCAIFALEVNSESWCNFDTAKKTCLFLKYPKSLVL